MCSQLYILKDAAGDAAGAHGGALEEFGDPGKVRHAGIGPAPSLDTARSSVVRWGAMRTQSPDTSPEAERVLLDLLRQAPPWRKLRMVEDTNRSVKDLLMAGLRQRVPHDPPLVIRRRLADLWLGPELSTAANGPPPEPAGLAE
jgi:hypothetical protein